MTKQKSSISENDRKIDWKEYLSSEDNINHLLTRIGIDEYQFVDIRTQYVIDDNRYGLIVIVKEKEAGNFGEIIIDTISGEPTWAQLMDCTFNFDGNFKKQIIIYSDGSRSKNIYNHHCDQILGINFAKHNNYYNIDTCVVKGSISTDERAGETIKYQVEVSPNSDDEFNGVYDVPPLKGDMEKVLLWLYYDEFHWCPTNAISRPEEWTWEYETESLGDMNYKIDWNEDGAFIKLTVHCYKMGEFKWLLTNHYQKIHRLLRDSEVTVDKKSAVIGDKRSLDYCEIVITIIDQPFSEFTHATPDKKRSYVERILDKEAELIGFYLKMIQEMCSDEETVLQAGYPN